MHYLMLSSVATPVGDFHMIIEPNEDNQIVLASGFGEPEEIQARLPEELTNILLEPADGHRYARQIRNYFLGDMHALDNIPHHQEGSPFFSEVWSTLEKTHPGEVLSYHELAEAVDDPAATQAAGKACNNNRLALLVPCHRAIKGDGDVGNYQYGSTTKKFLLQHEASFWRDRRDVTYPQAA